MSILPPLLTPNITGGLGLGNLAGGLGGIGGAAGGVLSIPLELGGFFLNQVTAIPNTVVELTNSVVGPDGNLLNLIDPLNLRGTLAPNDTRAGPDGVLEPIEFVDPLPYIINLINPITPPEQRLRDLEIFQQNTTLGIALEDSTLYQLILEFDRQVRETQGNIAASLGLGAIADLLDPFRLLTTTTTKQPDSTDGDDEDSEAAKTTTTAAPGTDTTTAAPEESSTEAPGESSTDAPGEETTTEGPGGETSTDAPVENSTDAPGEESTQAPGEESTEAPGEETTTAPEENSTEAPEENSTEAPGEETTEAPEETSTDAP